MLHWTLPSSNLVEIRYAEIENNIFFQFHVSKLSKASYELENIHV